MPPSKKCVKHFLQKDARIEWLLNGDIPPEPHQQSHSCIVSSDAVGGADQQNSEETLLHRENHRVSSSADQPLLRLLSWNINGLDSEALYTRTLSMINTIQSSLPDVVFLQEVTDTCFELLGTYLAEKFYIIRHEITDQLHSSSVYYCVILVRKKIVQPSQDSEKEPIQSKSVFFPNSIMLRHLLIVRCFILGFEDIYFLTTHLESCSELLDLLSYRKARAGERKNQLSTCFETIHGLLQNTSVKVAIFGGDLNLRDKEARVVLPKVKALGLEVIDVWEELGKKPETRYTWDITRCLDSPSIGYPLRMRLDRIYLCFTKDTQKPLKSLSMNIVGKKKLKKSLHYPSDHLGLLINFSNIF